MARVYALLSVRNELELELLRVNAEIDSVLGACRLQEREARAAGLGLAVPPRPLDLRARMLQHLKD